MASRASSDVVVRFIGDTGNLEKGLDGLKGRFVGVASGIKGIAAAAGTVAAVDFFKDAVAAASDLNEATSKTGVIFGRAAADIERYAATAAESIGQSKVQALDAASTFATFGKAAGLTGKDLSSFATEFTGLASDLASFHNADPAEVIEALGAGLRGEAEPMQRFGVLLNDAQLRNAALQLGLIKTTKEALTPQQKVLAAHKVIMDQTTDAQGDFARTSDGLANSQRTLAARFDDAKAAVGQRFLPVVTEVTKVMTDGVLPAVAKVGDVLSKTLVPVVETTFHAVQGLVNTVSELPAPIRNAALALAAWHLAGGKLLGILSPLGNSAKGFGDDVKTAMGAFDVGRVQGTFMALQERVPVLGAMGSAFRAAKGEAAGFGASVKGIGAAGLQGLKAAASGLMGVLGGPFGIALTAVTVGLTLFAGRNKDAEERQRRFAAASKEVAKVLAEENNELNKKTRMAAASKLEEEGLLKVAEENNINTHDLTDAYLGNDKARQRVNSQIRSQISHLEELRDAELRSNPDPQVARQNADRYQSQINALQQFRGEVDSVIGLRERESGAIDRTNRALSAEQVAAEGVAGAKARLMGSEQNFQAVLEATGLEYDANKTRLENLLAALQAYNNEVVTAEDSNEAWFAALDQLTASVQQNGTSLDVTTAAGRANRDALEDLSAKTKQLYIDNINAGMSVEQATAIYNQNMQQVYATAASLGFNKQEADKLIATYGAMPKSVVVEFGTKGYDTVWAQLQSLSAGQILGEAGLPVTPANVRAVQKDLKGGRYASGGEVTGPYRGPRADNVVAALTPGEVVQSNAAGDYYGRDFLLALNERKIPREALPRYAEGGAVGWPMPINVSKFKIPDPAMYAGGASIPQMQRWARAQAGKLYNWGSVGPDRYDCSGLVGNLYAMAHGLPLYRRYMTTAGMGVGRYGMKAGRGAVTVYLGPGHTAANIGGLHAEAYGGNGTPLAIGRIGTPLSYYNQVMHLAKGGVVALKTDPEARRESFLERGWPEPVGLYETGGWLMPGQLAYNETRKPERIVTDEQWSKVGGEFHFHFHGPIGSQQQLENWLAKSIDTLKRKGRV